MRIYCTSVNAEIISKQGAKNKQEELTKEAPNRTHGKCEKVKLSRHYEPNRADKPENTTSTTA